MKTGIFLVAFLFSTMGFAQTIDLNLHHEFNGSPFAYNQEYIAHDGRKIKFTRVQYFMSGITLTHDGGQQTTLSDPYVLGSGNITSYIIGNASATTIEGISFDVGVDPTANHGNSGNWPLGHPLSPQTPSMDWGWPSGYFFIIIDGKIDDDGDGVPNKPFELHGLGDTLLRNVNLSGLSITNNTIDLYVNVADWVKNIALYSINAQHNAGHENTLVADNTNDETVFTTTSGVTAAIDELEAGVNHISADYSMPYAPTLYYDLATNNRIDISIYDMSGAVVLEDQNLNAEGNYFIRKELLTGTYIAVFRNNELEERFRFIIQR